MPASRRGGLDDLAALRDALARDVAALAQDSALRESREREAARARHEAAREADLFRRTVGDVAPLKVAARVEHRRAKPEPVAHQYRADEAAALAESIADESDGDVVLDGDEMSSWSRPGVGVEILKKLRRGHWIIQAEVDLHGWRTEGARDLVSEFLRDSVKQRHRCVRIVHGKGHGSVGKQPVLKGKVKRWLVQKDEVLAFCQPHEHDGGGGALIVLLRPS